MSHQIILQNDPRFERLYSLCRRCDYRGKKDKGAGIWLTEQFPDGMNVVCTNTRSGQDLHIDWVAGELWDWEANKWEFDCICPKFYRTTRMSTGSEDAGSEDAYNLEKAVEKDPSLREAIRRACAEHEAEKNRRATRAEIVEVTKHWPPLHAHTVTLREFSALLEDGRSYTFDELIAVAEGVYNRAYDKMKSQGCASLAHQDKKDLDIGGGILVFCSGALKAAVEAADGMRKESTPAGRKRACMAIIKRETKKRKEKVR